MRGDSARVWVGEHADDVTLGHFIGQPSEEDPGRVLVLLVPGVLGAGHPSSQLPLVHLQLVVRLRLGIHLEAEKCPGLKCEVWKINAEGKGAKTCGNHI